MTSAVTMRTFIKLAESLSSSCNLMENSGDDGEYQPSAEWKALEAEHGAAMEAFSNTRTRANLERVWAAQKAMQDYNDQADAKRAQSAQAAQPEQAPPSEHDYRGEHGAPGNNGYNAPLWNVVGIYPEDFYSHKAFQYYDGGLDTDSYCISIIQSLRNRPNAPVKIYRSVPKDLRVKINPGDWVTLSRKYAVEHGRAHLNDNYRVISKTVFARDLFTDGNSPSEVGYDPQPRVARPKPKPASEPSS